MYERFVDQVFDELEEGYDTGYGEDLCAEDGIDAFEPTPPRPGTILLTHFGNREK